MKGPRIFASRFASLITTALVLAGLTAVALAGAQAPPIDTGSHLLVVPDTDDAEAALARTDARVVARYESFTLVEAAGSDDQRLRQAGADRRDDMRAVDLGGGALDPAVDRGSLASKGADPGGEELVLVQFVGPVKPAWLERLAATGGRVVGYAAQNGYLVHASGAAIGRLAGLVGTDPSVRAVVPVEADDKLDGVEGGGAVAVETVAGARGEEARERARLLGPSVQASTVVAGVTTQFLRLSTSEITRLADDPAVLLVEPYAAPTLLDERASQIAAANLTSGVPTGPGYLTWLASRGFPGSTFDFAIDVTDEGLDNGTAGPPDPDVDHPDLYEGGVKPGIDRVAYATDYTTDSTPQDCGGHGTNVTSIAAGYNDQPDAGSGDAAGFHHGLGVAPHALVGASKIFDCDGDFSLGSSSFTDLTAAAYAGGARISNNSWGFSGSKGLLGRYTDSSREYDALVRDAQPSVPGNQEMVEVFAAGNKGDDVAGTVNEGYASVTPPATAKNVISVGASESVRSISTTDGCGVPDTGANNASDVIDFSSRGPTNDERLKPDLVAPGTHVVGARPTHGAYNGDGACLGQSIFPAGTLYNLVSGTSQAAPVVAGAAALVRDWYRREHGGGTEVPSPALTKAILTNAATDVAGGADGKGSTLPAAPSNDAGWGRVNLDGALGGAPREFVDQSELLTTGGDELRSYTVPSPGAPVRVTLAWTDPPPATAGGDAFVNDLDLEVSAGGRAYLGNVFVDGISRTGGEADFRNNLESVVLPAGTADRFSVRVVAKTVGVDGVPDPDPLDAPDQDFALVVSNATEQVSPVLVDDETTIDDSLQGNGDGVLDPGESFRVIEEIGNAGDDAATGVAGTLTGSGLLNVTQPSSAYPDIGAGGSQENAVPFEANLAGAATCGVDAVATLHVTSDPGVTQQIPIAIPTGRPGAYFDRSRSGGSIPDDSTAGLSSTIDETRAGRIRDINLRISSLTHSWVGDLVIDITGPDGTRVRLVEHPGGPDNSANNFTNTLFDDEAPTNIAAGSAPYSGSFRPQRDSLSRFDGKLLQGTWTLRVRDLFEGDTGSLGSWGTSSSAAVCAPDIFPPETAIDAGPQSLSNSRSATFSFSSEEAGSTFECRLDGEQFVPCESPKAYSGLADGEHAFHVVAFDALGQPDASPAIRSWNVDATPPQVSVASPQAGSAATRDTPAISGVAGTAAGDGGTVTVRLFQGTLASGLPVQTLVLPRDGATGAWAGTPAALAPGTWTVRAEQTDAAGNVGISAPASFTVVPAPGFVVAPAEESVSQALAGRLRVLAACATACRASVKLTVSRRTARRLGLKRRSLGGGVSRLRAAGTTAVRVPLASRPRKALRRRASTKATLGVTVTGEGETLSAKRGIVLRRSAGLRRIARSGLRLWAACTRTCPLSGRLTVSAAEARRLGLKRSGSSRVDLASAGMVAATKPTTFTLKAPRAARRKLGKARSAKVLLEVVAGTAPDLRRSASLRVTLRR